MRATLKQIAEMTGVHRSTVDKVLHGREGVSDEVRERVRRLLDELDYQPNAIGKALAQQKKPKTIAVLLLRVDACDEIKAGIEAAYEEAKAFGFVLEIHVSNDNDYVEQLGTLQRLLKRKIDGVLVSPLNHPEIAAAINDLVGKGIPVVTVNSDVSDCRRICYVGQDALQAGRVAGALMGEILGGSGKVAQIVSSEELLCSIERQAGFEASLRERSPGMEIVDTIETREDPMTAFQKTHALLKARPDLNGLYITCGSVGEVGRAVRMLGLERKLKIVCFDLYPEIVQLVKAGVVNFTIGQNLPSQGARGMKVLFDLIAYGKNPESDIIATPIDIRLKENIDLGQG